MIIRASHGRRGRAALVRGAARVRWGLGCAIAGAMLLAACFDDGGASLPGGGGYDSYNPWTQSWQDFHCDRLSTDSDPCPDGYRLPTRLEWQELLGGCSYTWDNYLGPMYQCNRCKNSSACSFVLGISKNTHFDFLADNSRVMTSTEIEDGRYFVDLDTGEVWASSYSTTCAYCVRDSN